MDKIVDEITKSDMDKVVDEITKSDMDEIVDGIASLRAAREAEYAKFRSELAAVKYERKVASYKIQSAIKYESHVSSKHCSELQTQLSTLHTVTPVCKNNV